MHGLTEGAPFNQSSLPSDPKKLDEAFHSSIAQKCVCRPACLPFRRFCVCGHEMATTLQIQSITKFIHPFLCHINQNRLACHHHGRPQPPRPPPRAWAALP